MLSTIALFACNPSPGPGGAGGDSTSDAGAGPEVLGTGLAPTALRRLTPSAYGNTVRDLFPGVILPEVTLVPDPLVYGFDNNGESQAPSALLVQQLDDAAIAIAAAAAAAPDTAFGCPPGGGDDPAACGERFLDRFGPRVFRRPLTDDERAEAVDLFDQALAADGFDVAIQVAVQLWLQSPEFLYFPELGAGSADPSPGTIVPLTGYEVASRLSYFLWNSMPDDALFDAAAAGDLDTADGVGAEALRMLDEPRAADGVDNFDRLWLSLDAVDAVSVDPGTYPGFDDALRDAIGRETLTFARRAVQEGTLASLLTDPSAELDPEMARLYGVDAGFVTLPANERAGVLTRAAFLATRAHAVNPSPVKRGAFVLDRLLCMPPAPPPPGVDTAIPEATGGEPTTNRDRYEVHEQRASCAACHVAIDGIGFGFEHYDSLGAWRDEDAGLPVDATGAFAVGDLAGLSFDGAIEASALLAGSRTVSDCVVSEWTRYALGRSLQEGDEATVAGLTDAFAASGGVYRDLIVDIVTTEAFRARRTP
ncbi:MAG: DUF1592 domain-containing protein [Myxococcota bacterium]